jgi:DNA-binding NarL/FixJ family response regulator
LPIVALSDGERASDMVHPNTDLPVPQKTTQEPDDPWRCFALRYGLTKREVEMVPLLALRLTDREIAERMNLSHRTVMNHSSNILGKLGLKSKRDLAACLRQHGLTIPPESFPND